MAWLSVWSEVQMSCMWSSWCHCQPIISCSSKIQNGLPFCCRLTQVVLEKRPLSGYNSSSLFPSFLPYLDRLSNNLRYQSLYEQFNKCTKVMRWNKNCCWWPRVTFKRTSLYFSAELYPIVNILSVSYSHDQSQTAKWIELIKKRRCSRPVLDCVIRRFRSIHK